MESRGDKTRRCCASRSLRQGTIAASTCGRSANFDQRRQKLGTGHLVGSRSIRSCGDGAGPSSQPGRTRGRRNDGSCPGVDRHEAISRELRSGHASNREPGTGATAVGPGPGCIAAVVRVDFDARSKTLILDALNLSDVSLLHRPGTVNFDGNSDSANLSDLWPAIPGGAAAVTVEARINQSQTWLRGGVSDAIQGLMDDSPSGGNENWIVLRPIGQAPRS